MPVVKAKKGFPGGSDSKESAWNLGDLGSILGLGRSSGGGHGNPLQYSCLENLRRQRSLLGYSPWGHKEQDMTEWLNTAKAKTHCSCNKKNVAALRCETYIADFTIKQTEEFNIGKRYVANVMGEDPESFTQENIDIVIT